MRDISDLAEAATEVDSQAFLEIVDRVSQILCAEKDGCGRLQTVGRLVRMPPLGEATIIGDLHGDLESLKHVLTEASFLKKASTGKEVYMVFLGDYGDRGSHSAGVYYVVLSLKNMFPDKVVLLQGNHEGPEDLLASPHDLPYHLQQKFGTEWLTTYRELGGLFRRFYTAVLVEGKCIMLHGGVPSGAKNLDDLAYAFERHPAKRDLEEILWSDPVEEIEGTCPSPRGAGNLFGEDVTTAFLKMLNVRFVVRGHEPAEEGYKIGHGGKILTLFSRKGLPYFNRYAAYLTIDLSEDFDSAWELEQFIHRF